MRLKRLAYFSVLLSFFLLLFIAFPASANWSGGLEEIGFVSTLPDNTVYGVVENIMLWVLAIFTLLAIISFVITGIMYLYAGASSDLQEKAKSGMSYAIIGIVIGLSGYIIINLINDLLEGGF